MSDHSIPAAAKDCPSLRGLPPGEDLIRLFMRGELPESEQDWWESHLDQCPACRARLEVINGPFIPFVPETVLGASILVARLGPAQASLRALARVSDQLHKKGWRVSEPTESPAWAVYDTSSRSTEGSPVDARLVIEGIRLLQDVLPANGPVGAWLEVGRGILGQSEVWGETFEHALTLPDAGRVESGRIRVSGQVHHLVEGLGLRFHRLSEGAELQPVSHTLQQLGGDNHTIGYWSGLLADLMSLTPHLTKISLTRGSSTRQVPATATSFHLDTKHRLQLELTPQAGLSPLLLWETPSGWEVAPEQPAPSVPATLPIRLYPTPPVKVHQSTLWLLVVHAALQKEVLYVLNQATGAPCPPETLADQLRLRLTGADIARSSSDPDPGFVLLHLGQITQK